MDIKTNEKIIFHCDMDNFFASVELLDYPQFKHLPVAVSGDPTMRSGIILAKNSIAKAQGVKTAETIWSAKQKCPNLVLLPANHRKYKDYSKKIINIYNQFTDLIEPFSIDEAWLDLTGVMHFYNNPQQLAEEIKSTIKSKLGLSLSIGISNTKFFSKMGSSYKKPYGTTLVNMSNFLDLFGKKDVSSLFFVGSATATKLREIGCKTVEDLLKYNMDFLNSYLGKHGQSIYQHIHGLSDSTVTSILHNRDVKSIGHSLTFPKDLVDEKTVKKEILGLSEKVGLRLRKKGLQAYGIKLDIKDSNFNIKTKQKSLAIGIVSTEEIAKISFEIYKDLWRIPYPIRLISVTAINLEKIHSGVQTSLFDKGNNHNAKSIDETLDKINNKFGRNSIYVASLMKDKKDENKVHDLVINQRLDEI